MQDAIFELRIYVLKKFFLKIINMLRGKTKSKEYKFITIVHYNKIF